MNSFLGVAAQLPYVKNEIITLSLSIPMIAEQPVKPANNNLFHKATLIKVDKKTSLEVKFDQKGQSSNIAPKQSLIPLGIFRDTSPIGDDSLRMFTTREIIDNRVKALMPVFAKNKEEYLIDKLINNAGVTINAKTKLAGDKKKKPNIVIVEYMTGNSGLYPVVNPLKNEAKILDTYVSLVNNEINTATYYGVETSNNAKIVVINNVDDTMDGSALSSLIDSVMNNHSFIKTFTHIYVCNDVYNAISALNLNLTRNMTISNDRIAGLSFEVKLLNSARLFNTEFLQGVENG